MVVEPFNPLDKKNLGLSIAQRLRAQIRAQMPIKQSFQGAGVYALYYAGLFPPYQLLASRNRSTSGESDIPIYVGKAVPKGSRKGGFGLNAATGNALFQRLGQHAQSIQGARNLQLEDFFCRYLVVDDVFIPLGESLLIATFSPLWNLQVEGFGNHQPGKGRHAGKRPAWDTLHPGRPWADHHEASADALAIETGVRGFLEQLMASF